MPWQKEKPTEACACAYEENGVVYIGVVYLDAENHPAFKGDSLDGEMFYRGGVCVFHGHWLILDVPPPPKLPTPHTAGYEAMLAYYVREGKTPPTGDHFRNAACEGITAALAAAGRGELDMGAKQ
jgi:hypothetical protein